MQNRIWEPAGQFLNRLRCEDVTRDTAVEISGYKETLTEMEGLRKKCKVAMQQLLQEQRQLLLEWMAKLWSYVKKKYKLNMNSILIFLIMSLQFRVSSIVSSNFSHVCSAVRNYNDYESLPCYKMSRYIQIQAYMYAYNPLF